MKKEPARTCVGSCSRLASISPANTAAASYAYDPISRLSQLVQDPAGTTHDLILDFSYNPASQIASNTRSNDTYAWTGHGSGTTESPANGLNQLVSHGGAAVAHDVKGNVTSDPTIGYSYGYSSENLLTSVQIGSNTGSLRYDPLMRLYEAGISGKARFVYDGDTRIEEYSSSGAQMHRFVHGPGVDEPLIEYDISANTRRFLHADERGSIVALSRNDGVVTNVNRYDEYGKPADTNRGRFLFTGYPVETLTELYYARARMYNYRIGGRFMQVDPLGYVDGPNPYPYAAADPVNLADPSGTIVSTAGCIDSDLCTRVLGGVTDEEKREPWYKTLVNTLSDWWNTPVTTTTCGRACAAAWDGDPKGQLAPVTSTATVGERVAGTANSVSAPFLVRNVLQLGYRNIGAFTVSNKHLAGAGGRWARFATTSADDVRGIVAAALRNPASVTYQASSGRYVVISRNIGQIGLKAETRVKVVVHPSGRIITAYPLR